MHVSLRKNARVSFFFPQLDLWDWKQLPAHLKGESRGEDELLAASSDSRMFPRMSIDDLKTLCTVDAFRT
jgi:hypothetical protein